MPTVTVGDAAIPYEIRRSRRAKRLRIAVRPGKVEVVAPRFMRKGKILAFVDAKRGWIHDKTRALQGTRHRATPERFVTGAKVLFRGRYLRLTVVPSDVQEPTLRFASAFHVQVPDKFDPDQREAAARRLVTDWLGARALADARAWARTYGAKLGVYPARIRIGNQKTRWGSCSARGGVSLNRRLVAAPKPIFEYVVVHELCHLLEPNHGPAFWRLVGSLLPDYRQRRTWLKRHGAALG